MYIVQSAFDVVQHKILLDKLLDEQIHPILRTLIKDMYSGLTTRVKWLGELSESFPVLQGVRQGGILSTHLYKMFVENLLLELENAAVGFHPGNIYVGTPTCTCADDIAFTETNKYNLQVMLNVIHTFVHM